MPEHDHDAANEPAPSLLELLGRLYGFAMHYADPTALRAGSGLLVAVQIALARGETQSPADLLAALHRISLGSQNSGTSKEDLGRLAREAIARARRAA